MHTTHKPTKRNINRITIQYRNVKVTNPNRESAWGDKCGPEYTGWHYDPFLACGPDSQYGTKATEPYVSIVVILDSCLTYYPIPNPIEETNPWLSKP